MNINLKAERICKCFLGVVTFMFCSIVLASNIIHVSLEDNRVGREDARDDRKSARNQGRSIQPGNPGDNSFKGEQSRQVDRREGRGEARKERRRGRRATPVEPASEMD